MPVRVSPSVAGVFLILMVTGPGGAASAAGQEAQPDRPDFSGYWELDYEMSENPHDKLRWLYEVTRSQILQQQAAHQDTIRPGRMPAAPVNRSAIRSLEGVIGLGRLTEKIARATVLRVEQSGKDIEVHREGEFTLTCDFRSPGQSSHPLGEESCWWQDDQLVFQVRLPEGLTVRHRLVLSPNGKRLNIATTVSSSRVEQAFSLNRVYMPFDPGEGMYQCEFSLAHKKTCYLGAPDRAE